MKIYGRYECEFFFLYSHFDYFPEHLGYLVENQDDELETVTTIINY
jgi:hypothetical protein